LVVVLLAFRNTARQQQPAQWQGLLTDTVPRLAQVKRDSLKISRHESKRDTVDVTHIDISDDPVTPPPPPPLEAKDISSIEINKDNGKDLLILTAKDGHVEKYNMNDPKDKEVFEKKYGKWPPAPRKPAPPTAAIEPDEPVGPVIATNAKNIRSIDVVKANGQQKITLTFKDGRVEKYDLADPKDKKIFEEKYGKLVPPPPPPAPV